MPWALGSREGIVVFSVDTSSDFPGKAKQSKGLLSVYESLITQAY